MALRVLVATDAWSPQINGVVTTLQTLQRLGPAHGLDLEFVTPQEFSTLPLPFYPEIRLALAPRRALARRMKAFAPDAVHIATEGPIGFAARSLSLRLGVPFTTSFHTQFPKYLRARLPIPESVSYAFLRRFHNAGLGVMSATPSLDRELEAHGIGPLMRWTRGVDLTLFGAPPADVFDLPRPIFLNVGRVAVEKNLEAFLALDLPGSKVVVGDGPALAQLRRDYPQVRFTGALRGAALARAYGGADVFVFPSRSDTFGLVLIEALASGLPVAAYPVMGPRDVILDPRVGVLDEDLRAAALAALELRRDDCARYARQFDWNASIAQFARNIEAALAAAPVRAPQAPSAGRP